MPRSEDQLWATLKLAQERMEYFQRDAKDAVNVCKKPAKKKNVKADGEEPEEAQLCS